MLVAVPQVPRLASGTFGFRDEPAAPFAEVQFRFLKLCVTVGSCGLSPRTSIRLTMEIRCRKVVILTHCWTGDFSQPDGS